ncbi:MAG: AAA family ATPase [Chloroflexota bacterium]
MPSIQEANERIQQDARLVQQVLAESRRVVIGQDVLLERLIIALLCDGHVLIEGLPGLAKTLAVRTLAATLNAHFQRIQFTPDLLPADLIGTQIYNPRTGEFSPHPGPIFSNIILADEINRAPAKVQSALLEAMEERQVTLGEVTRSLPAPFMVLATQNPIEQEGTYPLPEAQLDRFLLKIVVQYPSREAEREIIDQGISSPPAPPRAVMSPDDIVRVRQAVGGILLNDKIKDYVLDIVSVTRDPAAFGLKKLATLIDVGASPRATLALVRTARAYAFLRGRAYVVPDDIKAIASDVLQHRLIPTFEAEAENITPRQLIQQILNSVHVP